MGGLSSALVTHGLAGLQVMLSLLHSAVAKCLFEPESIQTVNFIDNFKVANFLVRCVVFFRLTLSMPDYHVYLYYKKSLVALKGWSVKELGNQMYLFGLGII